METTEIEINEELWLQRDGYDAGLWFIHTPLAWIPVADHEIDGLCEALQKAKAISARGEGVADAETE